MALIEELNHNFSAYGAITLKKSLKQIDRLYSFPLQINKDSGHNSNNNSSKNPIKSRLREKQKWIEGCNNRENKKVYASVNHRKNLKDTKKKKNHKSCDSLRSIHSHSESKYSPINKKSL